jgi:hypothetical protein
VGVGGSRWESVGVGGDGWVGLNFLHYTAGSINIRHPTLPYVSGTTGTLGDLKFLNVGVNYFRFIFAN